MIDVDELAALLHAAARDATPVTYAEVLNSFGFAFTRPKMRALCALLGDVDALGRGAGRPELAVLVVRASDGLPGQGWWTGRTGLCGTRCCCRLLRRGLLGLGCGGRSIGLGE